MSWLSSSESDWSEEEEESSFKFEAEVDKLDRDINLDMVKRRPPAWSLGRKDNRALTDQCAPGPGTYALPAEQHLKHYCRRSASSTMAGKPLVLTGVSPGPLDYGIPKIEQAVALHPSYTLGDRRPDGSQDWLKKVPAPNQYKAKYDYVKDATRAFSIYHRTQTDGFNAVYTHPGPAHYSPQLYRKGGCTFGYRLQEVKGMDPAALPAPVDYNPTPVGRASTPVWSWARNAERFPGMGKSAPVDKKKKKASSAPPRRMSEPRQTKSSLLRASLSSQGSSRGARTSIPVSWSRPGTCELHGTRPGTSNIYDEVADPVVWPTPQASTTAEDVEVLKDKYSNWDRRPSSGRAMARRSFPPPKTHAPRNRTSNPYSIYQQYVNSGPSRERNAADKRRSRESMDIYKQFTKMGIERAADKTAQVVEAQ